MDRLLRVLGIAYICVGVGFFLVAPRPDMSSQLLATATGYDCEPRPSGVILAWPYYMHYYYGGGFAACEKARPLPK
jgi:hypothetical protein